MKELILVLFIILFVWLFATYDCLAWLTQWRRLWLGRWMTVEGRNKATREGRTNRFLDLTFTSCGWLGGSLWLGRHVMVVRLWQGNKRSKTSLLAATCWKSSQLVNMIRSRFSVVQWHLDCQKMMIWSCKSLLDIRSDDNIWQNQTPEGVKK